jgi:hypothetical protein
MLQKQTKASLSPLSLSSAPYLTLRSISSLKDICLCSSFWPPQNWPPCKLFAMLSRCARYAPAIQSLCWLTYLSQLLPGLRTFTSSFTSISSIVLACLAFGRIQHISLRSLISLTPDSKRLKLVLESKYCMQRSQGEGIRL